MRLTGYPPTRISNIITELEALGWIEKIECVGGVYLIEYKNPMKEQLKKLGKNTPKFVLLPMYAVTDKVFTLRRLRVFMAILSWRKRDSHEVAISREMLSERTGYLLNRISSITVILP